MASVTKSISYENLRNITASATKQEKISHLVGLVPAREVVGIQTDKNVRGYFADSPGKKETTVHKAIRSSIESDPEHFHLLHGGVTLVCAAAKPDDKGKVITLSDPSCINGANTCGVFKSMQDDDQLPEDLLIKLEIIVLPRSADSDREGLVSQISIARNMQNKVEFVSIAGAEGVFDELKARIEEYYPGKQLQTSETDLGDSFIPVDEVIRASFALMPEEIREKMGVASRSFSYHQAAKSLQRFGDYYKSHRKIQTGEEEVNAKEKHEARIYAYVINIAPRAYEFYQHWRSGWAFERLNIRNGIDRDKKSNAIKSVSDGLIFPLLGAFSQFVKSENDTWSIDIPKEFNQGGRLIKNLMTAWKQVFADSAGHRPATMGRSSKCWDSLYSMVQMAAVALER